MRHFLCAGGHGVGHYVPGGWLLADAADPGADAGGRFPGRREGKEKVVYQSEEDIITVCDIDDGVAFLEGNKVYNYYRNEDKVEELIYFENVVKIGSNYCLMSHDGGKTGWYPATMYYIGKKYSGDLRFYINDNQGGFYKFPADMMSNGDYIDARYYVSYDYVAMYSDAEGGVLYFAKR